jgi:hypothetical protein
MTTAICLDMAIYQISRTNLKKLVLHPTKGAAFFVHGLLA